MRVINEILLHCEATPEGEEFSDAQVNECHRQRKFSSYIKDGKKQYIGYHYIIHLNGEVHACRPESIVGCHATGHNSNSIGISYVGGCPPRSEKNWMNKGKDTRTIEQRFALFKLVRSLMSKYNLTINQVKGHYEVTKPVGAKACPSFDMNKFRHEQNQFNSTYKEP